MLLEKYFNDDMVSEEIDIEDQKITLNSPRHMLTLLIYLQETVFYSAKTFDLLITYGLILIEWK